ncbi:hypothetical protein BASA62_008385 [Batrachochytrium salamandrivorans]|nr:hypothetical protein BASA62_008385 [Batrachochytrium salamandrivorans]
MLNDQVPEATDVLFALQCQQFIECVRRSAPEALCFAQQELGKFAFKSTKYSETLRDIVALIAYTNPETSPLSTYMSQSRNEHVAMSLNSYILSYHGSPSRTALERLAAHATVLREQLHADLGKDKKSTNSSAVKSRSDADPSNALSVSTLPLIGSRLRIVSICRITCIAEVLLNYSFIAQNYPWCNDKELAFVLRLSAHLDLDQVQSLLILRAWVEKESWLQQLFGN